MQRYNTRLVRGREGFSAYEARTKVQYEARKEECGGEAMWVECMWGHSAYGGREVYGDVTQVATTCEHKCEYMY